MSEIIDNLSEEKLSYRIDRLRLPTRPYNALRRAGVYSIHQILDLGPEGVRDIRNIGVLSFDIIFDALAAYLEVDKGSLLETLRRSDPEPKPQIPDRIVPIPVSILDLSSRSANALERADISSLGELMTAKFDGLMEIRGIGETLSDEIEEVLDDFLVRSADLSDEEVEKLIDDRPFLIGVEPRDLPDLIEYIVLIAEEILTALGDERDFEILRRRHGLKSSKIYTLQEIGDYYGISRERVRQLQSRAEQRIQDFICGRKESRDWRIRQIFVKEYNEVSSILRLSGPILLESEAISILKKRYNGKYKFSDVSALRFLLLIMEFERFTQTPQTRHIKCYSSWLTEPSINTRDINKALRAVYGILKKSVIPLSFFEIMVRVNKRRKHKLSISHVQWAMNICKEVEEISDSNYQIKLEYLPSLGDQAYRIIYEHDNPLHTREILRIINHNLVKAGFPPAIERSLRGQMVSDDRLEPIGRSGIWCLSEWDHVCRDTIIEIMEEYFHLQQDKASVDDVFEYVNTKRDGVSRHSIMVYLSTREEFVKISEHEYELASWGSQPPQSPQKMSPKVVTERLTTKIRKKFTERQTKEMPLTELLDYLVDTTKIKRKTIYAWMRRSDMVVWNPVPGNSPNKKVEYVPEAQPKESRRASVRENIQQEIREQLRKQPHFKERVAQLAKSIMKSQDCSRSSFYGYLSQMDDIQKEYDEHGSLYCTLLTEPEQAFDFPKLDDIEDHDLRHGLRRAVSNLNIDDIDMGLFQLGKIFENVLRAYLLTVRSEGIFRVTRKDLRRLVSMIDCVEGNGIIRRKHHLTLLREQRNERAHGEIPTLKERKKLMQYAPFLGDLYIHYIKFFYKERKKIIDSA